MRAAVMLGTEPGSTSETDSGALRGARIEFARSRRGTARLRNTTGRSLRHGQQGHLPVQVGPDKLLSKATRGKAQEVDSRKMPS